MDWAASFLHMEKIIYSSKGDCDENMMQIGRKARKLRIQFVVNSFRLCHFMLSFCKVVMRMKEAKQPTIVLLPIHILLLNIFSS